MWMKPTLSSLWSWTACLPELQVINFWKRLSAQPKWDIFLSSISPLLLPTRHQKHCKRWGRKDLKSQIMRQSYQIQMSGVMWLSHSQTHTRCDIFCPSAAGDQPSQSSGINGRTAPVSMPGELLVIDGCWGREKNQFFLCLVMLHFPCSSGWPLYIHIKAALLGFQWLHFKKNRTWRRAYGCIGRNLWEPGTGKEIGSKYDHISLCTLRKFSRIRKS